MSFQAEHGTVEGYKPIETHLRVESSPVPFYEQKVVKAFCELTRESSAGSFGRLPRGIAVARIKGRRSLSGAAP
jgi:hypothetical protein